jgi:hypothetical protein
MRFSDFLKNKDPDMYSEMSIGSGINAGVGATLGAQATNSMMGNLFAPPAPNPMAPKPAANTTPAPQNTGAIIGALSGTAGALATTQKSLADAKTALDKITGAIKK